MFRPAFRALARPRILPLKARRTLTTAPPHKTSRSFKNAAVRWGLAGGLVYYYNVSNVWAEEPVYAAHTPPEIPSESSDPSESIESIAAQRRAQARATQSQTPHSQQMPSPSEPPSSSPSPDSAEALEEEAGQQGAFNEETGEINWDCPCLGGMAHGPCGEQFRAAFSCFVFSKEEPKGVDCIENFKGMQDCFRQHPEIYGAELDDEEVNEVRKEENAATARRESKAGEDNGALEEKAERKPAAQRATDAHHEPVSESEELVPKAWHDGTDDKSRPGQK